ncbi:MAG TPA: HAD family phosphatase [Gaiella sp.]|uniref:HAD family hydrolase n=1 Tax=Gaiella sp. TaxID=2663207 RepID=UPI002D7F6DD0|nr:HAD family phosphatase [Gaiella sp.]HET9287296.1 HAD family phosphatase [Gaiella sp.]
MVAPGPIDAVVFDMDGVLVDTEHLWDEVREELTEEWGGRYTPEAQEAMMGMSSPEWSRYLHEVVGLREPPEVINEEVVRRMLARYETELPVVPGAVEAVHRLSSAGLRLALASSSNRELIDAVLRRLDLTSYFELTVSSEEVERGKPAPDVYLEVARRLGVEPSRCAAVEDSASGIRAAHAAGLHVVAYPNRHYPPAEDVLALADAVVESLAAVHADLGRG